MSNWQERLKDEYAQLKEKYEKLKAYNNSIEVERHIKSCVDTPEEAYCNLLMREQQAAMGHYLHTLEIRARLENIKL